MLILFKRIAFSFLFIFLQHIHSLYAGYSENDEDTDDSAIIKSYGSWREITHLDLSSYILSSEDIIELMDNCRNLEGLFLRCTPINNAILGELTRHTWVKFNSLNLTRTNLNLVNISLLSSSKLNQLTLLNLRENNLNNGHMKTLFKGSGGWINLKSLDLSYNEIGFNGIKHLAKNAPIHLESIDLEDNQVCDDSLNLIVQAFSNQLVELIVRDNIITEKGIGSICNYLFPKLEFLDIGQNLIESQGLCLLKQALKCNQFLPYIEILKDNMESKPI